VIKHLIKFSASYAGIEGLQKGVLFLMTPLFTFYMSPKEYGVVATILMIVPFLIVIFSLSIQASIVRYYYKYKDNKEDLKDFLGTNFILLSITTVSISTFIYLFGELFFSYFFSEVPYEPYIVYALIIGATQPIIIVYISLLKAMQNLKLYMLVFNSYFLLQILLIYTSVVIFNLNNNGYLLSLVIVNILFAIIVFILIKNSINICFKIKYIKETLKYCLPIIPVDGIGLVSSMVDRYYILKFVGLAGVGVYFIGYQVALIVSLISRAINSAYTPMFFNRYESNNNNYDDIYKVGEYFVYVTGIIALSITNVTPLLVSFLFADTYMHAKDVVIYLSFSSALTSIYFLNTNALSLEPELVKFKTIGILVGAIITIVLSYYMSKYYGLVGAAISTLIGFFITTLILIFIVRIKTQFRFSNAKSILFLVFLFSIGLIGLKIEIILYKVIFTAVMILLSLSIFEYKQILRILNGNNNFDK